MIVRPPWSKALRLRWWLPNLADRLMRQRYIEAVQQGITALSGVHPISRGDVPKGYIYLVNPDTIFIDGRPLSDDPAWQSRSSGRLRPASGRSGGRDPEAK